ncbi:MAG: MarR family winged helix-turn-helix transcriptional regulator [Deltaproteobacteria bacterium]|nr:MarR family winged helix-turn-helix transcriptional regulator [Deltaproteobacteria bacterium]
MTQSSLHYLLERVGNLLRERARSIATREGLKLAQLDALVYLSRANRYSDTTSGVVDYLGATKGSVSQTLTALERKKLVDRVPDPSDGRVNHCRPTSKGRRVAQEAFPSELLEGRDRPELERELVSLLGDMQRAHGGRGFGVCGTCVHFNRVGRGHRCGLTGEPLTVPESRLLCREHERPVLVDAG